MSLQDMLVTVPPREIAGSRTADRFAYQQDWALCHLLQLHETGEPYVMLFDYHDDVAVLDSEEHPQTIAFFQIKTKESGHWTITSMIRAGRTAKGAGLSHVAKLYTNTVNFPTQTKRLTFVSNTHVACTLENGASAAAQVDISFKEISEKGRVRIAAAVKKQCELPNDPTHVGLLVFSSSSISLRDHAGHAQGKVSEFLERLLPGREIRPGAVYKGLAGEISRRTHCTESCTSFGEIVEKQGLSRKAVDSLFDTMRVHVSEVDRWRFFEDRLNSEHCPISRVVALRKRWPVILAQRTDPKNTLLRDAFRETKLLASKSQLGSRLVEWLDDIVSRAPTDNLWRKVHGENDIRVIALITLDDDTQPTAPPLPPSHSDSKDAAE